MKYRSIINLNKTIAKEIFTNDIVSILEKVIKK